MIWETRLAPLGRALGYSVRTGQTIKRIISGEAKGGLAACLRTALAIGEPLYRVGVTFRNRRFDRKGDTIDKVTIPVVSVGNLTTGGTGKSPLVRDLVQQLMQLGGRPAIVSRGYGSGGKGPNDEARELAVWLPDIPHEQNPDRPQAARDVIARSTASGQAPVNIIVLDDGFQHRRLARDLDLVLIDATCPFGYGHLLPRGLLREPIASLRRADGVIITRVDQVPVSRLAEIRAHLTRYLPPDQIMEVAFHASSLIEAWPDQDSAEPDSPKSNESCLAFCGVGNPQSFRETLRQAGIQPVDFVPFPDHYRYSQHDLDQLVATAGRLGASRLICTVKDLVKVRLLVPPAMPVAGLGIETRWVVGQDVMRTRLKSLLTADSRSHPSPQDTN